MTIAETKLLSRAADSPSSDKAATVSHGWAALLLALAALPVAALYWRVFPALVSNWELDPNYSHGYLVPVVSLYFAVMAWREYGAPIRARVAGSDVLKGVAEILLGLVIHTISLSNLLLDVAALICILRGSLLVLGGRDANRDYGVAALFLIFMAPVPALWYQPFAILMQQIASSVSEFTLDLFGVSVFREGYLIHLPGYTFEVGAACSGLRQLVAVLALSVAIAHLSKRGAAYGWTLGLLSIPIAVAANCLRVTLSGFIYIWFGRQWAEGIFHTLEGVGTFIICAVLVGGTAVFLRRFFPVQPPHARTDLTAASWVVKLLPRAILLLLILGGSAVAQAAVYRHLEAAGPTPQLPLNKPLQALPKQIGDWVGVDQEITDPMALYGDEHLERAYYNEKLRQRLVLWMVYSHDGRDRQHHPEVCHAVIGMPEDPSVRQTVDVGPGAAIQQYRFGSPADAQWVFYWYYTLVPPADDTLTPLQQFYRGLSGRPASLTIEVFAPEQGENEGEHAREFAKLVDAAIQEHLVSPYGLRGSQRTPIAMEGRTFEK